VETSRTHEVWVLAPESERGPIERFLSNQSIPTAHFHFCDLPQWLRRWNKDHRFIHLHYHLWQVVAYLEGRRLHKEQSFDVVHHLTLGMHWKPSYLAQLPVPFIWGPLGGGERAPANFQASFSLRGRVYEWIRDLARTVGELDPFVRLTARRALLTLAKSDQTATRLKALGAQSVSVFIEAALPCGELEKLGRLSPPQDGCFRIVSLGRLIHWKGADLGLRAFAEFHREFPASEYRLIGEGPERWRLERLARSLGVESSVIFAGQLQRSEVLEEIAVCSILAHPSLHDSGGWVCLEAMAAGRPVVCLDLAGPALQVTAETGFKIQAISPAQAVHDLALAFATLASDRELMLRMGRAGRRRVEESFSWARKADAICKLYCEAVSKAAIDSERLTATAQGSGA
jgi:glycosyltransferase involved in cell wall biosynthesis